MKEVEKWGCFELSLMAQTDGNPFLDVELCAEFIHNHRSVKVRGFYDGEGTYKIRFMPDMEGTWRFKTLSNLADLDKQHGEISCISPADSNHGPVRVIDQYHFAYADGTSYHPVGTTCYVWNHQGDLLEEQTLDTLQSAPFNKMRMCVFPKRYTFNYNEPDRYPFAGEVKHKWDPTQLDNLRAQPPTDFWDFGQFNPEYFQNLEKRILDLQKLGIEADLILFHPYDFGAWGFDKMPVEVNYRYLQYLVSRIAAFRNVWFSFANEYDLMLDRTTTDWDNYFKFVQDQDPYNHLRSIHNCVTFYDHRKPWVTHCSVQHANLTQASTWLQQYGKPVVVDECGYEGDIHHLWGSLSPEEMLVRFWLGFAAGAYVGHGETYVNEEEQLWWSKGGKLVGESAPRIAFLRKIIEQVPAPGLIPVNMGGGPDITHPANIISAGHNGTQYYLFYFGMHQPRFRFFNLPEGSYHIDFLDTWNMTIERVVENARGDTRVELPRRKFMAIRIEKNQ